MAAMCGVGGCVLAQGGRPDRRRLELLAAAMAHRGPDDSGLAIVENVGLVHTRLAILDPTARGHQPMADPSGRWLISFNGEVFNHHEIRQALTADGYGSSTDTETVLRALARDELAALAIFNGQFALAALDVEGRRLVLARDRFGIKPLYVAHRPDGVWFASEPGALRAAGLQLRPRAGAWEGILRGSCYGGTRTLLDGVDRLAPGTSVEVDLDDGRTKGRRWWSAASEVQEERQDRLAGASRAALAAELEGTLRAAVHDALMSDVPVGTLCSGGVDSSLIAALALEVEPGLMAFGARHRGDPELDEGPAAQRTADVLGLELDLLDITEEGWRSGFCAATVHFGAPLANASSVPIAQMAARARARGIKVLLTGEGADELFAGYSSLHATHLDAFLATLDASAVARPSESRGPVWSTLTRADDVTGPAAHGAAYAHHDGARRDLEVALLSHLDYTLCHLLNRMDKNVMQAGVESRVPFLDPRVVSLALNLPLEARVTPGNKGLLRDVAARLLPEDIAQRPKVYGMDLDAGAWIERAASPRFLTEGVLRDALQIPIGELRRVLDGARRALQVRLWSAEVWCRSVLDGQSLAAIERALWPHGP